jgi:hypothetical protein
LKSNQQNRHFTIFKTIFIVISNTQSICDHQVNTPSLSHRGEVNDGVKKKMKYPTSVSLEKQRPVRGTVRDIENTGGSPLDRKRRPKKFEET